MCNQLRAGDTILCPGIPFSVSKAELFLARKKEAIGGHLYCVDGEIDGAANGPLLIDRNGQRLMTEPFEWEFKWCGRIAIALLSEETPDIVAFGPNPAPVQPLTRWTIAGHDVEVMGLPYVMPLVAYLQGSQFLGRDVRTLCPTWFSVGRQ